MANIDLSGEPLNDGRNLPRIGGATAATGFSGSFDGNGYTITGLTIDATATTQGLFGYISTGGEVRNLGLMDVNIKNSAANTGSIAGQNAGTIENCYVTGMIESTSTLAAANVGGLVGGNLAGGVVDGCFAAVTITAAGGNIGGIVGINTTATDNNAIVSNCFALNESISTTHATATTIGRVTGSAGGTRSNNLAWRGIPVVTSGGVWTPNFAANGKDAPNIFADDLKASVNNWPDVFQSAPWVWTNDKMPSFNNSPALDWPEYLVDIGIDPDDPILIHTIDDLRKVGRHGANGWTLDAHYRLMDNITLPSVPVGQSNWVSIGNDYNAYFDGTFDGNGHTITNLTISTTTGSNGCMFNTINTESMIKNLGLIDVNISVNGRTGGLVINNYGSVINCFITGKIVNTSTAPQVPVGGLVGMNLGTITNCFSLVTVTANSGFIGGIAGTGNSGSISNCVALNDKLVMISDTTRVGRISSTTGTNNYAWNGMIIETGGIWTPNRTTNGTDGADVSSTSPNGGYLSRTFWEDTLGWDFVNVWNWNGAAGMPSLKNSPALPWPAYLLPTGTINITIQPFGASGLSFNGLGANNTVTISATGTQTITISNASEYSSIQWLWNGMPLSTNATLVLSGSGIPFFGSPGSSWINVVVVRGGTTYSDNFLVVLEP